jgi:outer membrane protein assembly complex protein YaeT
VNISFIGNRYFQSSTLRERLYMAPARFPSNLGGRYSDPILEQDKQVLVDLYRSNGFRDAQVVSTKDDDFHGKQGNLSVMLEVKEGTQWFVGKLELDGVAPEDEKQLRTMLQSTTGEPFSETNIAADRESILSYFYNSGYPDATFDWSQSLGLAPNQVDLRFVIHPGKRQFVRGILVRGLETTNPRLVQKRISLRAGDPISQNRIAESQQKLYDLGIFSKVQTALQNPDGEEDSKYVLFHLDEASRYSFNAGFGAELARIGGGVTTFDSPAGTTGFSPRISLGVSRLNFLGLGHTVGIQTLASTLEQRAQLTYVAQQFMGQENLSLTFSGLFDVSHDVRTFTAHRLEGSVQLAQRVSRSSSFQYRYVFRRVTVPLDSLKISSPELIPLLSQPDRAGLVAISFVQDRRDDPTDSKRGMLNTVDTALAWKGFGSETDYTRLVVHNSSYHRLSRDLVLARSFQLGYIQRLGGVPEIPLPERFFSGGASTNRAFPDNQAGPRDTETGFPLGGSAFLFNATELRFPLIGANVGGVLFHDVGNVYSDISHLSLRFNQKNIQDFNYAVHSFGFGVRYRTPVGPIRVDLSYSPNSPRFFGFSGTRDELLAGTGTLINQRINVIQFHFSLGQTF